MNGGTISLPLRPTHAVCVNLTPGLVGQASSLPLGASSPRLFCWIKTIPFDFGDLGQDARRGRREACPTHEAPQP
jgi:hypothetical protein